MLSMDHAWKLRHLAILILVSLLAATAGYWQWRRGHVRVKFLNKTPVPVSQVLLSYNYGSVSGARVSGSIPALGEASVRFPCENSFAGYSLEVTFADGHRFKTEGRMAYAGSSATEAISRDDSRYDADAISGWFEWFER
jgi:hypothetical protein